MAGNVGGYVLPPGGGGGSVAGSVNQGSFASGVAAMTVATVVSGYNIIGPFITEENISGIRAVSISPSGNLRVAMASIPARMPAIGVAVDNALSGIQLNVYQYGDFQATSGLVNYSGYVGTLLYVSRSGLIVTTSGSWNSGGFLSGDIYQAVGVSLNSGGFTLGAAASLAFVVRQIQSGNIGSGQISHFHLASGTVQGQAGDGSLQIASGTIGMFDLGSGAIVSGRVSSGAISTYDTASGITVRAAQNVVITASGLPWNIIAGEPISGIRAVCLRSGTAIVAMASVSGRMPAVGIVIDGVLSGISGVVIYTQGLIQFTSGLIDYSGYLGKRLWVGRSGQVVTYSGSFNSGGHLSGDIGQAVGFACYYNSGATSGAFIVNVDTICWSGGPQGIAAGAPM